MMGIEIISDILKPPVIIGRESASTLCRVVQICELPIIK